MKKLFFFFLFPSLLWAQNLSLEVGQTIDLPLTGSRIWVEKSSVIKAEVRAGKVVVTGKSNGESQIRIGSSLRSIQVIDQNRTVLFELLKVVVQKTPGLHLELQQGAIEVHGYLHSWEQWKSLLKGKTFESTYLMKARFSTALKENLQKLVDQDLASQGLLSININQEPHLHVRLHPEQQGLDLYQRYFQLLGIPVVLLKESLTMEPSVRVHITVAEVSKKFSRKIGMQWLDTAEMSGQARFDILPEGLVNSETLQAKLVALESSGEGKVLASPNLICRSGKEAEFLAGGEFPIRMMNFKMQDIVWKRYGVLLKIKPLADSSGKMSISIETEISKLGPIVENIPSIETNKVSSHFDISHSQVIALSGLLRNQNSDGYTGLPWLSQLPVLGPLFSSKEYLAENTELVIFVRPTLMNHESLANKNNKPQHLDKLDGHSKSL